MTDPIRLVESGDLSPFENELLESARLEKPDARLSAILLSGIGAPVALPAPELLEASMRPSAAIGWSRAALLRVVAGVGLGGALTAGWLVTRSAPEGGEVCAGPACAHEQVAPLSAPVNLPSTSPAVEAPAVEAPASLSAVERVHASSSEEEAPPETPTAAPAKRPKSASSVKASPAAPSTLTEEIAALEPARVALRSGDASLALRVLARYHARFPSGVLRPEAEALQAQAREKASGAMIRDSSEKPR